MPFDHALLPVYRLASCLKIVYILIVKYLHNLIVLGERETKGRGTL